MRRPLRSRFWYYRPFQYLRWVPVTTGGDEFNWHTVVVGVPLVGHVVFAHRKCGGTGACREFAEEFPEEFSREWPVDMYGHNTTGPCAKADCYCKDQ